MRIHSLSSFYMQQLYQNSNHPFISEAIFVPISTINKSCNKNKIFSMTYLILLQNAALEKQKQETMLITLPLKDIVQF